MKNILLLLLLFVTLESQAYLYENSKRRPSTGIEERSTAWLVGNRGDGILSYCPSIYVKNNQNLPLIAAALHCVSNNPEAWCKTGKITSTHNGVDAKCRKVMAWDKNLGIVLLLMEKNIKGTIPSALFTGLPKKSTRLKIIGFPGDKYAHKKPNGNLARANTVENCWIKEISKPSPINHLSDTSSTHNCSVFLGNSGGPVLIEGSDIAIGMPSTYTSKTDSERWDYNQDAWIHAGYDYISLFKDFVELFRPKLESLGVALIDRQPPVGPPTTYLSAGKCTSKTYPDHPIFILPMYETGTQLKNLQVRFINNYKNNFTCNHRSLCRSKRGPDTFEVRSYQQIKYTTTDGRSHLYSCESLSGPEEALSFETEPSN